MEFHSLFIENPARLSVRRNQLVIAQEQEVTLPMEDLTGIMLESRAVTVTAAALQELAEHGVTVYFCDRTHLPGAVLLPMNRSCRQLTVLRQQLAMTLPAKKRVWQTVVSAKIRNQARCLELLNRTGGAELRFLAGEVRSGDPDNYEAAAAAAYFPLLFGQGFTRGQECRINSCLNYGYAILRGMVARCLAVHGLEPCMGIFHHNALNPFNLADDLMEPYRPLVDLYTASAVTGEGDLTPELKHRLFELSHYMLLQNGKKYQTVTAVGRMTDSFCRLIEGQEKILEVPELLPLQLHRYE